MHSFSKLVSAALAFGLLLSQVAATCTRPLQRKEWRTLRASEKQAYIKAVGCMQTKPGLLGDLYPGVRSRFDDFLGLHINQTDFIHFVGFFQPWHRLFVATYEASLRSECGYTGAQPYWDWSLDSWSEAAFLESPVFDPATGFGGNGPYINSTDDASVRLHIPGKTGGGCVLNGPFKDMSVNMGPGLNNDYNPHCLTRDFSPWLATQKLQFINSFTPFLQTTFSKFDVAVQGSIDVAGLTYHGGGHLSVGGDLGTMGDVYASPGDPLFFLHHANMDRLWNLWQRIDFPRRSKDIAGPTVQFTAPFDFFGPATSTNVTLDYAMDFKHLASSSSSVKISEVMDIQAGRLCYTYV
ncbi:hypothetical protein V501_09890 [Pseudogymnoascus sp. VKM F-4519 (FW-2642)]|nr:hypothetical protein V501_09890 [Pseudogymnoascus sp. VKM F-4519 (FW-2642)]